MAFCSPAAVVTKVGFWLIAIVIAGRAGVGDHELGAISFGRAVLMQLADVQVYCGEGRVSSKLWCLFRFVRSLRKTETDT
ncbi:hypothetical protein C1Y03_19495 [Pseudomonas sp. FW306-02-H05-AA]|uniref:Uncharacterized protein n=1 Tax=Pseudomonas fluorescens TaxID=294 RepID=A0A0N9W0G3_PSEFL|nr:hypothetical protein AO353_27225 [Pseudomonas fluorescens]PMZ02370.1 hypothetical protein C1Y07_20560 [Pseudomonas sp. FW306-02-F02-AB]PMZ18550.1 hypothetical protein C1Y09_28895 [Pseudomonas sp. FW306-02-F08-AA]PMZ45126.1 hypothetical protein C1Y03_19495 [Pseudomonas sp. FW306-02-H05-AA]PMZ57695.1 hypothetical protein C1X96_17850 [Pseudomonas sp. FW300-N1A5]